MLNKYIVRIEQKAQKELSKISEPYYTKVKFAILDLAKNPRPVNCKNLKGRDAFRIRVADYRIIYEVFDDTLIINVISVGHRKDIYL